MKVSKGEQKIIYKKQRNIFGCYHIKVLGQDKRHITAIDLDDKDKEKTFNTSRVLEVLDKSISEDLAQEKLSKHKEDYKNRELPSSFVHGKFFSIYSKARGSVTSVGELVINLRGSQDTLERDVKVFKLLIYYLNTRDAIPMGKCKRFVKKSAPVLFGYHSDYQWDYHDFTAEGKKELIDSLKDELEDDKNYLKSLIADGKIDDIDPNEDEAVIDQIELIESQKRYLKIVRSDYRQELVNFFCREYYQKYDDSIFYDVARDFPIKFEES